MRIPALMNETVRTIMLAVICIVPALHAHAEDRGTAEEAQDMVARAIAYYDEVGHDAAINKFNIDPAPEFLDRDLYIFVVGPSETIIAHAFNPDLVGVDINTVVDADGNVIGTGMMEAARDGEGWIDYKWADPITGKNHMKSSWVVRHGDNVFGVGIYMPEDG